MNAVSLSMIANDLPQVIRKKKIGDLTRADRKVIYGMLYAKDIVQRSYQKQAKLMTDAIREKRAAGYCGGFIYCLEHTGKAYMCPRCKKKKANPKYTKQLSDYGRIRKVERQKARSEKK